MDNVNEISKRSMVSSSSGRGNERGRDLYVFQASDGRIKIGRSGNPRKRRLALQTAVGRKLITVMVLPGRGADETAVHQALSRHRLIGEWFTNTKASRRDIAAALNVDVAFPVPIAEIRSAWLEQQREARVDQLVDDAVVDMQAKAEKKRRQVALVQAYKERNKVYAERLRAEGKWPPA